ncbi:MAG: hypothetical protein K6C36_00060 [Clostridia bacterium]|nr:hypothetical protein [Clostridia bacterium]
MPLELTRTDHVGEKNLLRLLGAREKPRSVLFVAGSRGARAEQAFALAKALLCESPDPDGSACGRCPHCVKVADGFGSGHPDLITVGLPERSLDADTDVPAAKKGGAKGVRADEDDGKDRTSEKRNIPIRDVRENLLEPAWLMPHEAKRKVFAVIEAQRLGIIGQNAMLKITEETPDDVYFIFTAPDRIDLIDTILSRFTVCRAGRDSEAFLTERDPEAAEKLCADILSACARGDGYGIMLACAPICSAHRDVVHDALVLLAQAFAGELALVCPKKSPADGGPRLPYPPAKLAALVTETSRLAKGVSENNLNTRLAGAKLTAELAEVSR